MEIYLLGCLSLISLFLAIYMIHELSPVRSAFALIGIFLLTALHWFVLHAEFLATMLILVYVGAIMVLFLFVIMMIQGTEAILIDRRRLFIHICSTVLFLAVLLILLSLLKPVLPTLFRDRPIISFELLANSLFTKYLIPFELCGVVLFVAMISAVSLTFRGLQDRKNEDINHQVLIHKKDRLSLIKDMTQ
jgi:NADH-quinone oxidoreductase subunit J